MSYRFLLDIAIMLLCTKLLGLLAKRLQLPQVVGALLAGLLIGPTFCNWLHATDFITQLAEIGVIIIMFTAGLETDLRSLKKIGSAGIAVASLGVIVPLLLGGLLGFYFNRGEFSIGGNVLLQNIFIGTILTATSVSITVQALKEMGKLNSKVGNTILAAAIIDDILGLIVLTIVTGLSGAEVNLYLILGKIIAFFTFAFLFGRLFQLLVRYLDTKLDDASDKEYFPIVGLALCFITAFCAEHFFGVADIIGAFVAGLFLSAAERDEEVTTTCSHLSENFLSPIFFASIGIKISLHGMNQELLSFTLALILVAVISKIIGCGLGAILTGCTQRESLQIGVGMVCRGEVALIVANEGMSLYLMPPQFFSSIVIMVIVAAVLTPVLLKLAFRTADAN